MSFNKYGEDTVKRYFRQLTVMEWNKQKDKIVRNGFNLGNVPCYVTYDGNKFTWEGCTPPQKRFWVPQQPLSSCSSSSDNEDEEAAAAESKVAQSSSDDLQKRLRSGQKY